MSIVALSVHRHRLRRIRQRSARLPDPNQVPGSSAFRQEQVGATAAHEVRRAESDGAGKDTRDIEISGPIAGDGQCLVVAGTADNILKPFMLGRGVEAPMPVILLGALGGMATTGILGMFLGATLLALGYQIFMWWVANNPDSQPAESGPQSPA